MENRVLMTYSANETYELGKNMGQQAVKGQVYCLTGDLGTGKTVFTQGFAAGLGVKAYVDSPTFTIVKEYHDGRMPFYHFDVYRITDASQMDDLGYEEYFFGEGVCLVEWGREVKEILPSDTIYVDIEKNLGISDEYRKITIKGEA